MIINKEDLSKILFALVMIILIGKIAILPQFEKGVCKICDKNNYTGKVTGGTLVFNCSSMTETEIKNCEIILEKKNTGIPGETDKNTKFR